MRKIRWPEDEYELNTGKEQEEDEEEGGVMFGEEMVGKAGGDLLDRSEEESEDAAGGAGGGGEGPLPPTERDMQIRRWVAEKNAQSRERHAQNRGEAKQEAGACHTNDLPGTRMLTYADVC
jgi:hypothetical protein